MFAPAHLRRPRRDRAILGGSLLAIALLAWASLAVWAASPFGVYLHHEQTDGPIALEAVLFVAGWVLMIVAMMLPSSIPLTVTFGALVSRRRHPGMLVAILLAGYLVVWGGFGLLAWILDRGIHAAVNASPWLQQHSQLILGTTLLAAGLWQFSPLRDRCLDQCRSPLGFIVNRWRGAAERRESFAMGVAHGAFCVGCCWSLMLVMFGVGLGSVPAMLGLGALTAVEKNLAWGRQLTRPLGLALLGAGIFVIAAAG